MASTISQRVARRRQALRAAGLRPIQIWVPDTRSPDFAAECRRQALAVAVADAAESDLDVLMDAAFADLGSDEA